MASNWQRWKGIMKCYPFEEKRLLKWQPPFIVHPKLDGDRCRNEPLERGSFLLSSEENIFYSVPHINEQLNKLKISHLPLDGELYNHEIHKEGGHELIHSICSRTVNLHPRYKEMEYWVFDLQQQLSQAERIIKVKDLPESPNIKTLPYWICDNLDDIMRVYDRLISMDYEGIIVRNIHASYEMKRSTWIMKFKPKKKDSYEIVGFNEEVSKDGNFKGSLGSLICASGDGNTFAVGSGFTQEQRQKIWQDRHSIRGKNVVVAYQHLTSGKGVPRFPIFVEVKNDSE